MKCAKCGAELKVGCMYCSVCGQEAQIVPDYNLLEDDLLKELLKDEKKRKEIEQQKKVPEKMPEKKKKSKTPIIAAVTGVMVLLVIVMVLLVNYSHNNSYEYQMEQADACVQKEEWTKAQKYLEQALKLQEDSTEAWMLLADTFLAQGENDDAIDALKKVIELEDDNKEAYQKLIGVYAELEEYDAITELSENVKNSELQKLFSEYQVAAPAPDLEPGEYEEQITVEITTQKGAATYYTLDGSDPKKGKEYKKPIELEEGETTLRMISVNELGIYSEETECTYEVTFAPPEAPEVTPDGGRFSLPQQITVNVPEGCKAYYTWDGSEPTANSEMYTGALEVPEGNNILSVILVDERERCSGVTKCNFIYIP